MSDKQKQNTAIMFGVALLIVYFLKGTFIDKPSNQMNEAKISLGLVDERKENLQNLKVKTQSESVSFSEAESGLKQLAARFPQESDEAKVFNMINKVTGDFPEVKITKRSTITKDTFIFHAKFPEEDINKTYDSLQLPGTSGQALAGQTIISNGVNIVRFDAKMEMEGDFQAFLKLLARLYAQPYYFEITDLDVYAKGKDKGNIQGSFTVSTLAFGGPVVKDRH